MIEMNCPFCNTITKHSKHIYLCARATNNLIDKKEIRFRYVLFNFPEISTKEKLIEEYQDNLMSLPDLKKKYNLPYGYTYFLLDYFNIPKRTLSESALKITQKKYKQTCQEKYGVDNVSQRPEIKEKKKETFLKHYGVDNIWKSKTFVEWLEVEMLNKYGKKRLTNPIKISETRKAFSKEKWEDIWKKYIETSLRIYGTNNPVQSDIIKEKVRNIYLNKSDLEKEEIENKKAITNLEKYGSEYPIHTKYGKITKPELKIQSILNDLCIPYSTQKKIGKYFFDILIKNIKYIIEVQGDYWHANPAFYNEFDMINYPNNKIIMASDVWKKDDIKRIRANKDGYNILYIWENEINTKSNSELEFIILDNILNRQNELIKNQINN